MKRFLFFAILLFSCLTALAPTVQVTGTGTVNAYPFWRNASSITTTSALYQANGFIGVNTTNPATEFHVESASTATPRGMLMEQNNTGTHGARYGFRKSRGTFLAPTIIVTGDELGSINAWGYDGANFLNMAGIDFVSSGTIAATRVPNEMRFYTATDAAPSVKTLRLTIDKNGTATFMADVKASTSVEATGGSAYLAVRAQVRLFSSASGALVLVDNATALNFVSLQLGADQATPSNVSVEAGDGSGTDRPGGNIRIIPGLSTGAGTSGTFSVWTGGKSSTGSTLNTATNRFEILALGEITFPSTITAAGTTTTQTINKPSGRINIAAAGTTATVNNSLVTTNSLVFATIASNDTTATLKNVVSGTGSFVITLTAAANAETKVNFWVINQ